MSARLFMTFARHGVAVAAAATLLTCAHMHAARADDARSYISDAETLLKKGDLRGAEIQLRNAVRERPNDPSLHVKLASLYLSLNNLPAAEAEAREAQNGRGDRNEVDPVLAEALRREGKFTPLFELIKPSDREPKAEAKVRVNLGLAHMQLRETNQAGPLLHEAEQLDESNLDAKLALAQWMIATGDLESAAAEVRRAHELAPDEDRVLLLESQLLIGRNDNEAALARLNEILAKNPDDVRALLGRASVYFHDKQIDKASEDLTHALKVAPKDPMAIFFDSVVLAGQGKLQKADDMLTEIVPLFSVVPVGYYVQGIVKFGLGQYAQAEAALTKYLARAPKDAGARRLLAAIALQRRDAAAAIEILRPAVDADPADVQSMSLLAQAYVATGQRNKALALYEKAVEARPGNVDIRTAAAVEKLQVGSAAGGIKDLESLVWRGEAKGTTETALILSDLRAGRIEQAAAAAETMVEHNGKDPLALNLLGIVRGAQGNYPEAAKIFASILEKDHNLVPVKLNLARAYMFMRKNTEARAVLDELLKQDPNSVEALMVRAKIAANEGSIGAASADLQTAQRASTKDPTPGLRLLELYAEVGDWDRMKSSGRALEGQFPGNPSVIETLARLMLAAKQPANAAAEFQKLTQLYPQAPQAWSMYSRYQFAAGDKDGARQSAGRALELAPSSLPIMRQVVELDENMKGPDAALRTAQSFAPKERVASDLLVAETLARAHRTDEAIAYLTEVVHKRPSEMQLMSLANLVYASGNHQQAEGLLQSWIKDHPDTQPARMALANDYLLDKDFDAARALYEAVIKVEPDNSIALNNLAAIYAASGDPRAPEYAAQAYWHTRTPQIADTLGWALVSAGRIKEALYYLREASLALPANATVQYHLAAALEKSGDDKAARSVLEPILKKDPQFDAKADAEKLLARLRRQ